MIAAWSDTQTWVLVIAVCIIAVVTVIQAVRWMFRRDKYWLRQLERERNAWQSERRDLLDRIMLLAGNPWTPPPAQTVERNPEPDLELVDEADLHEVEIDYW
jgi:hypothetical protein